MLLITENRNQRLGSDFREIDPGTASAKMTLHRQTDRRLQSVNPHKGDMNPGRFLPALRVSEPILDHRGIEDVQLCETVYRLLVVYPSTPFDGGGVSDRHVFRILFRQNKMLPPDLLRLCVKPSWKEKEIAVLKTKTAYSFGNPTFAQ